MECREHGHERCRDCYYLKLRFEFWQVTSCMPSSPLEFISPCYDIIITSQGCHTYMCSDTGTKTEPTERFLGEIQATKIAEV